MARAYIVYAAAALALEAAAAVLGCPAWQLAVLAGCVSVAVAAAIRAQLRPVLDLLEARGGMRSRKPLRIRAPELALALVAWSAAAGFALGPAMGGLAAFPAAAAGAAAFVLTALAGVPRRRVRALRAQGDAGG